METSAAGKIILLGEHAAVYGLPAIAVPVSTLRAYAAITPNNGLLTISSADLDNQTFDDGGLPNPLEKMRSLTLDYLQVSAAGGEIRISSDIPMARGLGSGAAVSAALGRAIALLHGRVISDDALNRLVFEVETIHHGAPSGIDNTVAVYERPVYFVKGQAMNWLEIKRPLPILIADSGRASLTREAVAKVSWLYQRHPDSTWALLAAIGAIVEQARACLRAGDHRRLGELMTENHRQLQRLQVSSPRLDGLVEAALAAGALGAKLSGGGLGGTMIALVEESKGPAVREALIRCGAVDLVETVV